MSNRYDPVSEPDPDRQALDANLDQKSMTEELTPLPKMEQTL
jgi:hypothetical protein